MLVNQITIEGDISVLNPEAFTYSCHFIPNVPC